MIIPRNWLNFENGTSNRAISDDALVQHDEYVVGQATQKFCCVYIENVPQETQCQQLFMKLCPVDFDSTVIIRWDRRSDANNDNSND